MKYRFIFTGIFPIFLAACTLTSQAPTTLQEEPTIAASNTPAPVATFTPTPVRVNLTVKSALVNCRFGPGTTYELINELDPGESARVVARNEDSTWLFVHDPGNPNGYCWVSADVVETKGAVDQLPVQPNPFVTVTDVSLRAEPSRIVVNCDQFPQTIFLEAEVTSNGPTFVTWRWEASTGVSSTDTILAFEKAGMQVINDYYQIGSPNDYWVKLHILGPNEIIEEVKIPVNCTQ